MANNREVKAGDYVLVSIRPHFATSLGRSIEKPERVVKVTPSGRLILDGYGGDQWERASYAKLGYIRRTKGVVLSARLLVDGEDIEQARVKYEADQAVEDAAQAIYRADTEEKYRVDKEIELARHTERRDRVETANEGWQQRIKNVETDQGTLYVLDGTNAMGERVTLVFFARGVKLNSYGYRVDNPVEYEAAGRTSSHPESFGMTDGWEFGLGGRRHPQGFEWGGLYSAGTFTAPSFEEGVILAFGG
jgi:hypothetical protein